MEESPRLRGAPDTQPARPIVVLIADGEWQYREALAAHLRGVPGFEVTTVLRATAVLEEICEGTNVVFVDLDIPELDRHELLQSLQEKCPDVAVIVFTSSEEPGDFREALATGARGYLLKQETDGPERVGEAIRTVAAGGTYFGADGGRRLLEQLAREPLQATRPFGLTARELEVLELVGEGLSNKVIGQRLSITEQAAKNHLGRIFRKLGVTNRTAAALLAHGELLGPKRPNAGADRAGPA